MNLELAADGRLGVDMIEYLDNMIEEFPEEISGHAATPAMDRLFDVRDPEETERLGLWLPEEMARAFHRTVAQLLFVSYRPRRDVQTPVSFLTSRAKKPDQDDWGKLKRVLKYMKCTRTLKLWISIKDLTVLKWYIDGSHNVHPDCRGHAGAALFLGDGEPSGAASSYSQKVKGNTRSSTETELYAMDQFMPQVLWTLYFVQAQGYDVSHAEIMQDNLSTQLLAKNGKFSSSKKTKHIKAKFFFVTDKIRDGEIKVVDCPTERMWADILTKPLQGKAFREMRAVLMGCAVDWKEEESEAKRAPAAKARPEGRTGRTISPSRANPTPSSQECVGRATKRAGRAARKVSRTVGAPRVAARPVKLGRPPVEYRVPTWSPKRGVARRGAVAVAKQ